GGRSALLLEADLLWWTNARMTRRVLEPALAAAESVALSAAAVRVLFGGVDGRQAVRMIAEMGPRLVYLVESDGSVLLREGGRVHTYPAGPHEDPPRDPSPARRPLWARVSRGPRPD